MPAASTIGALRRRPAEAFLALVGAVATAYVFASSTPAGAVLYSGVAFAAFAAVVIGVLLHADRRAAAPWLALAAALAFFALGDAIWFAYDFTAGETPFPSVADAVYLAGYPLLVLVVLLTVAARRGAGLGLALDGVIAAVAVAVIGWHFLVVPVISDGSASGLATLVATAYPASDVIALGMIGALLFTSALRLRAFRLLLAGIMLWLSADVLYAAGNLSGTYDGSAWFDVGWILAYGFMGAAALDPSMRGLRHGTVGRCTPALLALRVRIPFLMAATLGTIGIAIFTTPTKESAIIIVGAVALPALVLLRLALLFREQAAREQLLQESREELRRSEERYRMIVETATEGIWLVDNRGNTTFVNESVAAMLGYSTDELVGRPVSEFMHPEDPAAASVFNDEREGPHEQAELRFVHRGGSDVWTLVSHRGVFDHGARVGALAMVTDITRRKEAEAASRASDEQLRAVFATVTDAVLIADDARRFVDANPAVEVLTGLSRDAIIGRRLDDLLAPPGSTVADIWIEFLYQGVQSGERMITRADGSQREVEFIARANILPGRHLVTLRDVSERNQLESQLRQAEKMQAVGQLAGGIAHDFNNLLLAIRGYAELVLLDLDESQGGIRSDIEEIKQAAERAATLTQQLLAFSRTQMLQPTILDVNELVGGLEPMLSRLVGDDVDLVLSLAGELPAVEADRVQIEQVVMNLAGNARDAMPLGGTLTLETMAVDLDDEESERVLGAPKPGAYVCLRVADSGSGMDSETASHAFEPFFTTKEQGQGTGLGLSTVDGIARQSGGAVVLHSEVGEGTTIEVFLPVVTAKPTVVEAPAAEGVVTPKGRTVLLVDDEDAVRRVVCGMLERAGYSVVEAADGEAALALAPTHHFDLIITDVVMPGISGPELIETLTASVSRLPVLYTSGYTDEAVVPPGTFHDDVAFLHKPFEMDTLLAKVADLVGEAA